MQDSMLSHNDQKRNAYDLNGEIRKRQRSLTTILVLLGFTIVPIAEARVWHMHPGDSIQAFVDSANPGDKIIVDAGEYHQSVIITKAINLTGNGAILDGHLPADSGTTLGSDGIAIGQGISGVVIKGFEIRKYASSAGCAIRADGASDIQIIDNMISHVFCGIYILNGKNVGISNNVVEDSGPVGIEIAATTTNSQNITVMNNNVAVLSQRSHERASST